jgi:hypothetical protein
MAMNSELLPCPVYLDHVDLTSGFWEEKQAINRDKTIPAIHKQLQKTGHLDSWYVDKSPDKLSNKAWLSVY